jgi:hypothetical protein
MTLDNPEQRSRETAAAGLVKGETACNRSACQTPLNCADGSRLWNTETRAYYCKYCAMRINMSSTVQLGREICITESAKWQIDMKANLDDALSRLTKPIYKA